MPMGQSVFRFKGFSVWFYYYTILFYNDTVNLTQPHIPHHAFKTFPLKIRPGSSDIRVAVKDTHIFPLSDKRFGYLYLCLDRFVFLRCP